MKFRDFKILFIIFSQRRFSNFFVEKFTESYKGDGFKAALKSVGFDEIEELSAEVDILLSTLNLDSASGVVVSAQ